MAQEDIKTSDNQRNVWNLSGRHFDEIGVIGQGASADVVHVQLRGTPQEYALKALKPGKPVSLHNVRRLCALKHPYLVTYHDVGCFLNGNGWILMEYCRYPLARSLESFRFTGGADICILSEAVQFARKLLEGISYLHTNLIIHGDLKPENILLYSSTLHDFPVPKIADIDNFLPCVNGDHAELLFYRTGACGTPNFMAPELGNRTFATAENPVIFTKLSKSDIWSFGRTMNFMLQQNKQLIMSSVTVSEPKHPYYSQDTLTHLAAQPPDDFLKAIPALYDFLHLCLRTDINNRPPADLLLSHYIFTSDIKVPFGNQKDRSEWLFRNIGTEYYLTVSAQPQVCGYTKFRRLNRYDKYFGVMTVDAAIGSFGTVVIWETINSLLSREEDMKKHPERLSSVVKGLLKLHNKEARPLCGLQHDSIFNLADCHYRYTDQSISSVYRFHTDSASFCLRRYMKEIFLPWNHIKTYCKQLLDGLQFLEDRKIRIFALEPAAIVLCNRHRCGTYLQVKIQTTYYLDWQTADIFIKYTREHVQISRPDGKARFISPEQACRERSGPPFSPQPATTADHVWALGHLILSVGTDNAVNNIVQFKKANGDGNTQVQNIPKYLSDEEVVSLLCDGWLPNVPPTLSRAARNILAMCFKPESERPSLQELASNQFFTTAMPLHSVTNGDMPVFRLCSIVDSESGGKTLETRHPSGHSDYAKDSQGTVITAKTGEALLDYLVTYRNRDNDLPMTVRIDTGQFSSVTFSPACDLIVDLTIYGVLGLNCEHLNHIHLPNLLSLRFIACTDIILADEILENFPKLCCLEFPNSTTAHLGEKILAALHQLQCPLRLW